MHYTWICTRVTNQSIITIAIEPISFFDNFNSNFLLQKKKEITVYIWSYVCWDVNLGIYGMDGTYTAMVFN